MSTDLKTDIEKAAMEPKFLTKVEEIKTAIRNRDLSNIQWTDVPTITAHPESFGLTFGEVTFLLNELTTMAKCVKAARETLESTSELRHEIEKLKSEIDVLKNRINTVCKAFNGYYDEEDEED